MTRTISIANQKGGVGKTTTAVNLASALGRSQKRVLLIDLDPHAASTSHVWDGEPAATIVDYMEGRQLLEDCIFRTDDGYVDYIASSQDLQDYISKMKNIHTLPEKMLSIVKMCESKYDFIVIDTPPDFGVLQVNAVLVSAEIIVPIYEYLSVPGLVALKDMITACDQVINLGKGRILRMLAVKADCRTKLSRNIVQVVHDDENSLHTVIPYNIKLAEAPAEHKTIFEYEPTSKGAMAYMQLAKELINIGA